MKQKKGQVTFYLVFIILAIVVIFITAVLAPFGSLINTEFYAIGEDMMLEGNHTASTIQDPDVRASLMESYDTALAGVDNNVQVNNGIFKYGFIIILVILALFLLLYSRRLVEAGYIV